MDEYKMPEKDRVPIVDQMMDIAKLLPEGSAERQRCLRMATEILFAYSTSATIVKK